MMIFWKLISKQVFINKYRLAFTRKLADRKKGISFYSNLILSL